MNNSIDELYNTQMNLASDLSNFFKNVSNISKPQLKIIPYIILGMIDAESVVTTDIVKKLKGNFSSVMPSSTIRRLERFLTILNLIFDLFMIILFLILFLIINYKQKMYIYQLITCFVAIILLFYFSL